MSDQDKRLGVYFHIPFCASKCAYCDFCSLPGRDKLMPYYQDALLIQLQETMPRMTDYFIDTVYFGGGTPSYYGARRIVEILQELKVTNRLMKQSEITVECNPDSVRRAPTTTFSGSLAAATTGGRWKWRSSARARPGSAT